MSSLNHEALWPKERRTTSSLVFEGITHHIMFFFLKGVIVGSDPIRYDPVGTDGSDSCSNSVGQEKPKASGFIGGLSFRTRSQFLDILQFWGVLH